MPTPTAPCTCVARRQTAPGEQPFDPRCPRHAPAKDRSAFRIEPHPDGGDVQVITTRHDPCTWEVIVFREGAEPTDYRRGIGSSRTSAREDAGLEVFDE